jgi:heterotetrameric sarcosine oxidase delta subunit
MLRIPCLYCGERDEDEFRFGGESHAARPALDATDSAWAQYLFFHNNPRGIQYERWLHTYGCGCWFNIARDTLTHEVLTVYEMGQPKPEAVNRTT